MKKLEILNDFYEFKDKYSKKIFYKRNNTHKIIFLNNIWGLGNQINIRKEKNKKCSIRNYNSKYSKRRKIWFKDRKSLSKYKLNMNSVNSDKSYFEIIRNNTEQSNNQFFLRTKSISILGSNIIINVNNNF